MAIDPAAYEKFKQKVRDYYEQLDSLREYDVKKHTTAWCIAKTAEQFGRKTRTVERIIYS